jgi:Dihydrodipicolinate synthetase family
MGRYQDFVPQGVIPAVLLPFHEDLSIDEHSFRSHLRDVAAVHGLSAITINAHSTEVASCTRDEQRRVMEITGEEVGSTLPIIHGVWADGSLEAARIARQAQAGGASALLVFPPAPFTLGQSAEMVLAHFNIRWLRGRAILRRRWSGCSMRCLRSAQSRTGHHWCRSTRARFVRCRGASPPSTCYRPTVLGC